MSWTTIIWSAGGGGCITMAVVYLLVWLKSRNSWANLSFALAAASAAACGFLELGMMHAQTTSEYGLLLRWMYIPIFTVTVFIILFIRYYLQAGRTWLVWLIIGLRVVITTGNFMVSQNATFRSISSLHKISFLGETLSLPVGETSDLRFVIMLSSALLLIFVLDAGITAWRQGKYRQSVTICGSMLLMIILAATSGELVARGILPSTSVSLTFMMVITAMFYELSRDLIRARQISIELKINEERMGLAARAANLGMWEWDVVRDEIWANEPSRARAGIGKSEHFSFDRFLQSVHPDDREATRQAVQRTLEHGTELRTGYRIVTPGGEERWVEIIGLLERNLKHKPLSLRGVTLDNTERKRAQDALQRSEHLARILLNTHNAMAHLLDVDGTIIDLNNSLAQTLGGTREGLIGTNVFDRFPQELVVRRLEMLRRVASEQKPMRFEDGNADGSKMFDTYIYPVETPPGEKQRLVVIAHDITDRKQAEIALKESEKRLMEAQRISHIGNWELDLLTNKLSWSDEVLRIFEIDGDQSGASYESFLQAVHPEDRETVDAAYIESLKTRTPYSCNYRILMPDGRIKHLHGQCETAYNADGKPLRSIGTIQDITERKQAESERIRLRNELAHLNRIMTITELSHSLAHEINQPLGAIMNNAAAAQSIVSRSSGGNVELREIMEDIIKDTNRAGQIIRKIRGVVKKDETRFELMNVDALIKDVLGLFKNTLSIDHISLNLDLHPDLPLIRGDRVRLQQVLTNLISNAIDAMAGSASRVLTIRSAIHSQDTITLSVSDSGTGIDENIKDKIFQPFFTTKKEGLGVGLRLCRSIIEEHGGKIWLENNPGGGTTFLFTLKADKGEPV